MFALLGLKDDYLHDGRVLVENLDPSALPAPISANLAAYKSLAIAYKQLDAPFGAASLASLAFATGAIKSASPGDGAYTAYLAAIGSYTIARNALADQIRMLLNEAERSVSFDATQVPNLVSQADALTARMVALGATK